MGERRSPLFRGRHFCDEIIVLCLRWYLRYKLSYREMADIAWELGVAVASATILRWVVRYAEEFANRWLQFEQGSLSLDECVTATQLPKTTY
jgi:transposase-like protein